MERFEKLSNQFYSLELYSGKTNFAPEHNILCFFIVEHPCSAEFIKEQALQLLMTPCRNFNFYGAYSRQWENGFDDVDITLHPDEDDMDIALTSVWHDFDAFVDDLEFAITCRYPVPCDIYLLYDDEQLYQCVIKRLKECSGKNERTDRMGSTMKEYVIYSEDDKQKFYELCQIFEQTYPQFEKEELIGDFLDGELRQAYNHQDKCAVIFMERIHLHEIELRVNFQPDEYLDALGIKERVEMPKNKQSASPISSDWKNDFKSIILERGKKYFETGEVRNIRRDGNTYISTVAGTDFYEVEITIGENGVEEMLCTCPYAEGDNCKHMAAVLFALESGDVSVEELPPVKQPPMISHVSMEIPWLEAIHHLPEDIVRKELQKRADRDEGLRERLAVLYLGKLPEQQLHNWKADLQDIAVGYTNRRGRIRDDDVPNFLNDLGNFLAAKLPLLCEVKTVMDAFHLTWIVMETALEWDVDDPYDDLYYLFSDCEEGLRKIFSMATDVQREQMLQWYREHRKEDWPNDVYYMDDAFNSLTEPEAPTAAKRLMRIFNHIPCFLSENEWIPFPKRHHIYYDLIEETEAYKEAKPVVDEIIKQKLGELYGRRGACNVIWPLRKQLLMEQYGIEWFTPVELNPGVCFD